MKPTLTLLTALLLMLRAELVSAQRIEPNWKSMVDNYQCPDWFQDGKIGIWLHWGPQSILEGEDRPFTESYPSVMYGIEDSQEQKSGYARRVKEVAAWHAKRFGPPSEFGYDKLIPLFKAERWDPDGLVRFFKECGVKVIVPISTHVDNFDMYDSSFPWNSVRMGPRRDVVGEWKKAAVKHGLKLGVSTHLYQAPACMKEGRKYKKPGTLEWSLFMMDYEPVNFQRDMKWAEHWYQRTWEVIEKYNPDWVNVDGPFPDEKRGNGLGVKLFSEYINRDKAEHGGKQQVVLSHKGSNMDLRGFTLNLEGGMAADIRPSPWIWGTRKLSGTWFYWTPARSIVPVPALIGNIVDTVSKNGLVLMNIALRGDGTLPEDQAAILRSVGDWLAINGEGIYGTRPWKSFGEGPTQISDERQGENLKAYSAADIRFTTKDGNLYAFVLAPPTEDILIKTLGAGGSLKEQITSIALLGSSETLEWSRSTEGLAIKRPRTLPCSYAVGFRIIFK